MGLWGYSRAGFQSGNWFEIIEGSVMLPVIPEPSTMGILLLGGLVTIILRRRMR